jgi:hypothetical protein
MNCRFGPKRPDDSVPELSPGANNILCELEVYEVGEFSSQLHLFVDDQGAREIVFTVRGTANPGKPAANPEP